MSKTKRFIFTLLTSGAATILSFLISFFLTPYITVRLGEETYGFVTLAKNFTSYAGVVTVALNSYASRYIGLEYHNGNIKKSNIFVSSVLAGDIVLSVITLALAGVFIIFMEKLLNISEEIVVPVKILFILVFISFVLTTVGTVFSSAAYIKNRLDVIGIFRTFSYVVECVIYVILFKFATPSVWYVGFALLAASFIVFIGNVYVFKIYTPELKPNRTQVSLEPIKLLVVNGIWNSINSLGNILNSGLDLLVSDLLLSGQAMGQIAITKTLSSVVGSFNQLISQPFQPLFLKSYSDGNREQLFKELKLSMKVSGLFSTLIFAVFFANGKAFYYLWIPNQDNAVIYKLTVLTFVYMFLEGPIFPLYYIYTLTVKNKIPCIITVCGGILNVLGMFILIKYTSLGIYSVVITTLVIMSIISLFTNPIYMTKCLKTKWYEFYPTFGRIILCCSLLTFVLWLVSNYIIIDSWLLFVVYCFLYSVFGVVVYFICVFNKAEKKWCINKLKRKN